MQRYLFEDSDWVDYRLVDVVDHRALAVQCAHCGTLLRYEVIVDGGRHGRRGIGMMCAEKTGAPASAVRAMRHRVADLRLARQRELDRLACIAANNETFEHLGGVAGVEEVLLAAVERAEARIASESSDLSDDDRKAYRRVALNRYLPFGAYVLDILSKASSFELTDKQCDAVFEAVDALESFEISDVQAPRLPTFVGRVGDKVTATGHVVRRIVGEPFTYGAACPVLVVVETADGDTVATWTTAAWVSQVWVGDAVTVTGTVKQLKTYDSVPQTMLTRVKLVDRREAVPAH